MEGEGEEEERVEKEELRGREGCDLLTTLSIFSDKSEKKRQD